MKELIERGAGSLITHVFIPDAASAVGSGKTGMAYNTSGLKVVVIRPGESAATKYLQSAGNIEDITTLGTYAAPTASKCRFKEIDATDLMGWYELQFADALYNTTNNRRSLGGMITTGSESIVPTPFQIQLFDPTLGLSGTSTYQAKVTLTDDNGGTTDRYVTVWFKDGQPVVAGITSPTIQVVKVADGSDLIASNTMTQIASLGLYRFDEATNRVVNGVAYIAKVTATIDGSARTWYQPVSRDS